MDYYQTLEVSKDATAEEIKKSYRKLALLYHPDKANAQQKEEYTKKFQEITEAYSVLSDEQKRKNYDLTGKADGEGINVGDIFSQFFGGNFPGHSFGGNFPNNNPFGNIFNQKNRSDVFMKKRRNKSPPLVHQVNISLQDLFNGKIIKLKITKEVIINKNTNEQVKEKELEDSWILCSACNGNGSVFSIQQIGPGMITQMQRPCNVCSGTGHTLKSEYELKEHQEIVQVDVKRGMELNKPHIIENVGHCSPGFLPGDIVIEFYLKPHPVFILQNRDLVMDRKILLSEALCGTSFEIEHLDGKIMEIKVDDIVKPNDHKVIKEAGMYDQFGFRGDLIIKFEIEFPDSLLIHQKHNIKKYLPKRDHSNLEK